MIYKFDLLTQDEVRRINEQYDKAALKDGTVKINLENSVEKQLKNSKEIDGNTSHYRYCLDLIQKAMRRNALFKTTYILGEITPPIMVEYAEGCYYIPHVDSIQIQNLRTDHSMTLFLSEPDEYEGGELVIGIGDVAKSFKEKAGTVIMYPTGMLHEVRPITSGKRRVSVMWATSIIDDTFMRHELINFGMGLKKILDYLEEKEDDQLKIQELLIPLEQVRSNFLRGYGNIS
ncbi:PiuC [Synechococcus phage S-PM2]|uniref:PiuC n=1 Tax=Synechococcus phage S-PM2 TaxID=238854 RepID=Q5GQB0_BPSYP|nr:2OG-Fe(II) oxygenase [Synechococcus phage S-PM2]CAF34292.1 PiuC [Synechococcus phage S-PM2]CFW42467.1 PiuC [Synechococcus phage S-PM2]